MPKPPSTTPTRYTIRLSAEELAGLRVSMGALKTLIGKCHCDDEYIRMANAAIARAKPVRR